MAIGLYRLICGDKNEDLTPDIIEKFIVRNPNTNEATRKRLLLWLKESQYWHSYAEIVSKKYKTTYYNSPTYQSMIQAIDQFISPRQGDVWLDAGCGALQMSKLILNKCPKVKKIYAMDVFLEAAKNEVLTSINNLKPIEFVRGSLTDSLPFPDNFFDGIVGNCVFTFIIEHEGEKGKNGLKKLFKEVYRVLKPGGILVWSSPRKNANNLLGAVPSIGYALNPYLCFKLKSFLPLGIAMILKHTKVLLEKGKNGTYPILFREEYETILSSIGFINPSWKYTFGKQGEAMRTYKP